MDIFAHYMSSSPSSSRHKFVHSEFLRESICHWETNSNFAESNSSSSVLCDRVSKVEVDHVGLVCSLHTDGKRLKRVENKGHKTFGGGRLGTMMTGVNLEAKQT